MIYSGVYCRIRAFLLLSFVVYPDISDHFMQITKLACPVLATEFFEKISYRNIKSKLNLDHFRENLFRLDWSDVLVDEPFNIKFDKFHATFVDAFNKAYPIITKKKS